MYEAKTLKPIKINLGKKKMSSKKKSMFETWVTNVCVLGLYTYLSHVYYTNDQILTNEYVEIWGITSQYHRIKLSFSGGFLGCHHFTRVSSEFLSHLVEILPALHVSSSQIKFTRLFSFQTQSKMLTKFKNLVYLIALCLVLHHLMSTCDLKH